MYKKSFNTVIFTKLCSLISCMFYIHTVRNICICPAHSVKVIINKSESVSIYGCNHIYSTTLKSGCCSTKPWPTCYTFKHNSVFFFTLKCRLTFFMIFFILFKQSLHCLCRFKLSSGCNHNSHMI